MLSHDYEAIITNQANPDIFFEVEYNNHAKSIIFTSSYSNDVCYFTIQAFCSREKHHIQYGQCRPLAVHICVGLQTCRPPPWLDYNHRRTFLIDLYKGKTECSAESLECLKYVLYQKYIGKAKLTSKFELKRLPLTSNAAMFHSLRAHHTIQQWHGRCIDGGINIMTWSKWTTCPNLFSTLVSEKSNLHPLKINTFEVWTEFETGVLNNLGHQVYD